MRVKTIYAVLAVVLLVWAAIAVNAAPGTPESITQNSTDRRTIGGAGVPINAQAGNISMLLVSATKLTNHWQGYYGEVSGTITLDDAENYSMYNWELATPQGEIYAVNNSDVPSWTSVRCLNGSSLMNYTQVESAFGMDSGDGDRANVTFSVKNHPAFSVGSTVNFGANQCRGINLWQNDTSVAANDFSEVILMDSTTFESVIFAAILTSDKPAYKNDSTTADFQMIVPENGDTVAATPYYFYVELS